MSELSEVTASTFNNIEKNPQYTTFGHSGTFIRKRYSKLSDMAYDANGTLIEIKNFHQNNTEISSKELSGYQKLLTNYVMEFNRLDDSRSKFWCQCLLSFCCFVIGLPIYLVYYYWFSSRTQAIRTIGTLAQFLNNAQQTDNRSISETYSYR